MCFLSVCRAIEINGRSPCSRTILALLSSLDARFDIAIAANLRHSVSVESSAAMTCPRAPELTMHDIFSVEDDKFAKALSDSRKTELDFVRWKIGDGERYPAPP